MQTMLIGYNSSTYPLPSYSQYPNAFALHEFCKKLYIIITSSSCHHQK